ncbi:tetratricopeptide repeat protein [Lentisalinibacter salinarum]|uniref:tetratricopeptide repeat protein n=1 Tax=Lentisalinibacter salinarum TaxID=2992239 RepID=UPI0038662F18
MTATGAKVLTTGKTVARAVSGLAGCLAIVLAAGCATVPSQRPAPRPAPLPEPYLSRVAAVQPPPAADEILDLTPEMLVYLETHIDGSRFRTHKVRSLSRLLLHPGLLGIDYDARRTGTAAQTFRSRTGNCLSLSILFVAMARELGLDARFQQVEVVPQWDMEGDVLFAARHVNVYGHLRGWGDYVMDFYPFPEEPRGRRRMLTDGEAIGQFYNNLGAVRLAAGDYAGAWVYFRAAIREAPGWSDTWSNLGLLYQRVGDARSSEDMLRHALALEPDNTSAINNLAVLLHRQARDEEAGRWLDEIRRVRESNPYYYYALARQAQAAGDYDRALSHIEHAMRMKRDETLFRRKAAEIVELLEDEGTGEAYRTTGGREPATDEPGPAIL